MDLKKVRVADMVPDQLYRDNGRVIHMHMRSSCGQYVIVGPPGNDDMNELWGIPVDTLLEQVPRMAVGKPTCPSCDSRLIPANLLDAKLLWSHRCVSSVCGWVGTYKFLEEDEDGGTVHGDGPAEGLAGTRTGSVEE